MFFTGATVRGSASTPNEDWAATTSDLVVLLDGATVRTETGCRHGASWYTRKLGASIIAGAARRATPLREVLADAIGQVAGLHPECDLTHPGTPSAGCAIVRFEHDAMRYTVLGDVTIVVDTPGGVQTISDQRETASTRWPGRRVRVPCRREPDKHQDRSTNSPTVGWPSRATRRIPRYWPRPGCPGARVTGLSYKQFDQVFERFATSATATSVFRWEGLQHRFDAVRSSDAGLGDGGAVTPDGDLCQNRSAPAGDSPPTA